MLRVVASVFFACVLTRDVLCVVSFRSTKQASSRRCGPAKIDRIENKTENSAKSVKISIRFKEQTDSSPIKVHARGIPCGTGCCSHLFQLRSGRTIIHLQKGKMKLC